MLRRQFCFNSSKSALSFATTTTATTTSSCSVSATVTRFASSNLTNPELLSDPLKKQEGGEGLWNTDRFNRNKTVTSVASSEVAQIITQVRQGLPDNEKARQLHLSRKKLLVRDRINQLIDPGTEFFELSPLAAFACYPRDIVPAAGVITGVGKVFGTRCMIMANDSTVKGGVYFPAGGDKQMRAQRIAQENCLPCIYLVDSGGGNLEYQAEGFADATGFGRLFFNQATMSSLGIPQVAVVMGSCTAGGAYIPCMSDETIIVKRIGTIFLGGPQLVQAATGEINTPEELGGGHMHCTKSGVADHLAESDEHALTLCRRVVKNLNRKHQERQKRIIASFADNKNDSSLYAPPAFPISDISCFVDPIECASEHKAELSKGDNSYKPVDTKGVISRLVDGSVFDEFKQLYGTALTCGFAEIEGMQVGIIADDGTTLNEDAGLKGTHFVQICSQRRIPLLFLQGGGSFTSKTEQENKSVGSASSGTNFNAGKNAAKFISAVATAKNIPKLTVVVRGCISDGSIALCGRSMGPRFYFLWPTAKVSMSPEAISKFATDPANKEKLAGSGTKIALAQQIADKKKHMVGTTPGIPFMSAIYSSARILDDGVVAPEDTRKVVAEALRCCLCEEQFNEATSPRYGVFRM